LFDTDLFTIVLTTETGDWHFDKSVGGTRVLAYVDGPLCGAVVRRDIQILNEVRGLPPLKQGGRLCGMPCNRNFSRTAM
jgi:hypothetical protein